MTDILLIYPPYSWPGTSPPLGLAYIASVLRNSGYTVNILDMNPAHTSLEQLENELRLLKPKIAGISCMTNQANETVRIAEVIKTVDSSVKVAVGGPHPTALPDEMLQNSAADFVCLGEGEITITELVEALFIGEKDFDSILGLAYKDGDGRVVKTSPRPFISDLDSIPFPAWDLLPVDKYNVIGPGLQKDKPVFALLSSRGCPYRCIFCSSFMTMGRRFRMRSAENIFAEIEMLYHKFGMRQFDFVDDTITVDKQRVERLCNLIIESKMDIAWGCNSTVRLRDPTILHKMREANCVRINFGVESGDPEVLKTIKKGITVHQVIEAHRYAKEAGLKTTSFFMSGLPGQDIKSVKKSLSLIEQIETDFLGGSVATPYPGTELYELAQKKGWLRTSDWSQYLTCAISNDYKPVMRTDEMSGEEILRAGEFFAMGVGRLMFRKKYGSRYYLNPKLYIDILRSGEEPLSLRVMRRKFKTGLRLIMRELKRAFV